MELNISNNNIGAAGATIVENALPGVKCITRQVSTNQNTSSLGLFILDSDLDSTGLEIMNKIRQSDEILPKSKGGRNCRVGLKCRAGTSII